MYDKVKQKYQKAKSQNDFFSLSTPILLVCSLILLILLLFQGVGRYQAPIGFKRNSKNLIEVNNKNQSKQVVDLQELNLLGQSQEKLNQIADGKVNKTIAKDSKGNSLGKQTSFDDGKLSFETVSNYIKEKEEAAKGYLFNGKFDTFGIVHESGKPFKEGNSKQQQQQDELSKAYDNIDLNSIKPRLSREYVRLLMYKSQEPRYLFMTIVDWTNVEFVLNWLYKLQDLNIDSYMIGATDNTSFTQLKEKGIRVVQIADLQPKEKEFMSQQFFEQGLVKIEFIKNIISFGVTAVITEPDVLWLQDPRRYFDRYLEACMLVAGDNNTPTAEDDGLEYLPRLEYGLNNGLMVVRPQAQDFIQDWYFKCKAEKTWDTAQLSQMISEGATNVDSKTRIFSSYANKYKFGVLPAKLFMNGNTFFVLRLHEYYKIRPYAVHVSNTPFGQVGKKFRYKEEGLWTSEDEYYNRENKFISLKIDVPLLTQLRSRPDFSRNGISTYLGHLEIANYQLKQLRQALAFAQTFNRILILPQFFCGALSSPQGVLGIGQLKKQSYPATCGAETYLNIWSMHKYPIQEKLKYNFIFKEHTFLKNPKTALAVQGSRVTLNECQPQQKNCIERNQEIRLIRGKSQNDGFYLIQNNTDVTLRKTLKNLEHFRVWELYNPGDIFSHFEDQQVNDDFLNQIKHYTSEGFRPFWSDPVIHYDILWDIIPHVDAWGKNWDKPWFPEQV